MSSQNPAAWSQIPFTSEIKDRNGPEDDSVMDFASKAEPKLLNLFPIGQSEIFATANTPTQTLDFPVCPSVYSSSPLNVGTWPKLLFQEQSIPAPSSEKGLGNLAGKGHQSSLRDREMSLPRLNLLADLEGFSANAMDKMTTGNDSNAKVVLDRAEGEQTARPLKNSLPFSLDKGKNKVSSMDKVGTSSVNFHNIHSREIHYEARAGEVEAEGYYSEGLLTEPSSISSTTSSLSSAVPEHSGPAEDLSAFANLENCTYHEEDPAPLPAVNRRSSMSVPDVIVERRYPSRERRSVNPPAAAGEGSVNQRRGPRSRSSRFTGVTHYKRTGRWEAHIWSYDRAAIHFKQMEAVTNFDLADYSKEMLQLTEISTKDLVILLRKQSAGAGRPVPDYPPSLRQLRRQPTANIEMETPDPEDLPGGLLQRLSSPIQSAAHVSGPSCSLLGGHQIDASHEQDKSGMQLHRNLRLKGHVEFSAVKEGGGSSCARDRDTGISSGNWHRSAFKKYKPIAPSMAPADAGMGSQVGLSTPGWGAMDLNLFEVNINCSPPCQHVNLFPEMAHRCKPTTASFPDVISSSADVHASTLHSLPAVHILHGKRKVDVQTLHSPQAIHVSDRKRKYLEIVDRVLNHEM